MSTRFFDPSPSDDELLLTEQEAVARFLDDENARRLRFQLWALGVVAAVYALVQGLEGHTVRAIAAVAIVGADVLLTRVVERVLRARVLRQTVAAVLIGHLLALQLFHGPDSEGLGVWFVVFALLASRFRVAGGEMVALFTALYAVVVLRLVGEAVITREPAPLEGLLGFLLIYLVCLAASWVATRRMADRLRTRWRAEEGRNRDRLRMKRELEYAREIQLSMLPRSAPRIPGLEVAALSLPATEVGGDYYDYFPLNSRRLAVVVGDVTGHGVASGLVLSGVRSCLNLLQDELVRPREVLHRVNTMLKRTTARRMLMTLGVAVLDVDAGEATVATAGHPPLLLRRSFGRVEEVGVGSLPLGAMWRASYREQRISLTDGDVLVIYSDGLVETVSDTGEQYGWERLEATLATTDGSAAAIRDTILRDLWEFKRDAEQIDDVTLVVIRLTDGSS